MLAPVTTVRDEDDKARADGACPRCGAPDGPRTRSMFSMEHICLDCLTREREHPEYERAREAVDEALRAGAPEFPGIGVPRDLQVHAPAARPQHVQ